MSNDKKLEAGQHVLVRGIIRTINEDGGVRVDFARATPDSRLGAENVAAEDVVPLPPSLLGEEFTCAWCNQSFKGEPHAVVGDQQICGRSCLAAKTMREDIAYISKDTMFEFFKDEIVWEMVKRYEYEKRPAGVIVRHKVGNQSGRVLETMKVLVKIPGVPHPIEWLKRNLEVLSEVDAPAQEVEQTTNDDLNDHAVERAERAEAQRSSKARLDEDGTAKSKTEIVGVYPEGKKNFYSNVQQLIVRDTETLAADVTKLVETFLAHNPHCDGNDYVLTKLANDAIQLARSSDNGTGALDVCTCGHLRSQHLHGAVHCLVHDVDYGNCLCLAFAYSGKTAERTKDERPENATKCRRHPDSQRWLGDTYEVCGACALEMNAEILLLKGWMRGVQAESVAWPKLQEAAERYVRWLHVGPSANVKEEERLFRAAAFTYAEEQRMNPSTQTKKKS